MPNSCPDRWLWAQKYKYFLESHIATRTSPIPDTELALVIAVTSLLDAMSVSEPMMYEVFCQNIEMPALFEMTDKGVKEHELVTDHLSKTSALTRCLRRWSNDYKGFLRCQGAARYMGEEPFLSVDLNIKACLHEHQALEGQLRDWLQLNVGLLCLLESKRSIELSDIQITESQRGRTEPSPENISLLIE